MDVLRTEPGIGKIGMNLVDLTQGSRRHQQAVLNGKKRKIWLGSELALAESVEYTRRFRKGLRDKCGSKIIHWKERRKKAPIQSLQNETFNFFQVCVRLRRILRVFPLPPAIFALDKGGKGPAAIRERLTSLFGAQCLFKLGTNPVYLGYGL